MNERYGLTAENMLAALPQVFQNDKGMLALATAVADTLSRRPEENDLLRIYAKIDRLPEGVLDILAYDFKVDWWDGDYTLEQKRQILKDSWRVHRMLGTKGAVEAAISAIYPMTTVQEWFEYGGDPYTFRLRIDVSHEEIDSTRHRRVLDRVNYYKNLRSHLDGVTYIVQPDSVATPNAGVAHAGLYARVDTVVQVLGPVERPHADIPVQSGARAAGTYLKVEVTINGLG